MLSILRSFAKSPAAFVIIGLLVLAFAAYGVGGIFTGSGTAVVVVGSEQISMRELAREHDRQLRTIQSQNPGFTVEDARAEGLGDMVLNGMVNRSAFVARARELGLTVSAGQRVRAAADIQAFRNPATGEFDRTTMENVLLQNGYTLTEFDNELIADLTRAQLADTLTLSTQLPSTWDEIAYLHANESRTIRGLFIDGGGLDAIDDPTDEQLQAYIDENRLDSLPFINREVLLYIVPERRSFTLIRFQVADFLRDVEVDESILRETYDFQVDNGFIGSPALRSYTQLTVPDEDTANAVAARLEAGETLADVAADLGLTALVEQTDIQIFDIPDTDLGEAVFNLPQGASAAVQGSFSWYAVEVSAATDEVMPTFEDMLPELREQAAGEAATDLMYAKIDAFQNARETTGSMEDAAAEAGVPIEFFGAMDDLGRTADLQFDFERYTTLGAEILPSVFQQFQGVETDLIDFNGSDFFIVRVDEVQPQRNAELDEVRDIADARWRVAQIGAELETRAADAVAQLEAGDDLDLVALTSNGRVETTTLTRSGSAGMFTPLAVFQAFELEPGVYSDVIELSDTMRAILIVDDVMEADPAARTDAFTVSGQGETYTLSQIASNTILNAAQSAVIGDYAPTIDTRLRDQALGLTDDQQ
ncbi:peptidylprolyl isomerase [Maricaulis sp.]|uniref:peptidylprolyl isomerase n=1 Tax=Maricaulis sp. TaxID=1486257 RepID=UPI00261A4023|nr:peptidylprolyl isomerase [Maricaulis sp.]